MIFFIEKQFHSKMEQLIKALEFHGDHDDKPKKL